MVSLSRANVTHLVHGLFVRFTLPQKHQDVYIRIVDARAEVNHGRAQTVAATRRRCSGLSVHTNLANVVGRRLIGALPDVAVGWPDNDLSYLHDPAFSAVEHGINKLNTTQSRIAKGGAAYLPAHRTPTSGYGTAQQVTTSTRAVDGLPPPEKEEKAAAWMPPGATNKADTGRRCAEVVQQRREDMNRIPARWLVHRSGHQ